MVSNIVCAVGPHFVKDEDYLTEINPPGGFGRPQVLVCDEHLSLFKEYLDDVYWLMLDRNIPLGL
jgi:hypothetical protein